MLQDQAQYPRLTRKTDRFANAAYRVETLLAKRGRSVSPSVVDRFLNLAIERRSRQLNVYAASVVNAMPDDEALIVANAICTSLELGLI